MSASGSGAPRTAADSAAFAARRDSLRAARAASGGTRGGFAQLWYVDSTTGKPAVMRVRTGLSDGQNTQVMGQNVKEGMQVIIGTATTTATTTTTSTSPFQQQRRGPGPGGPGGF